MSPFKFDAFNYYKSSGIPCLVGWGFDYRLTELYGAFKEYSYNVGQSQEKIRQYSDEKKDNQIEIELKNIENASEKFVNAFKKFTSCFCHELEHVKYVKFGKIKFWNWYLSRIANLEIVFSDRDYYQDEYEKHKKDRSDR
jgi:hypothetical protein